MSLKNIEAYQMIEERKIGDLNSEGFLLRHKKTGARVCVLQNDDDNKVFCVGFRTPPKDSTGVAHIIEHSVLCGSEKFPVKDPFVELVKGSLNTFLNAMTYPDKTVYPVASCNDKDLQNLMDVYLDAVFHPKIYKEKKIFEQEGWHYECEDLQSPLTVNGVVYNEMKGAFSSPDDVVEREIMNTLFPDTTYGVESGGDPEVIPELTYEAFLDFHRRFYHPSNSYIYLYGNMDMEEKLRWIDEAYLKDYGRLEIDSRVEEQKSFEAPVRVTKEYPISDSESEKKNTYLTYNTVIGNNLDKELYIAFQILDYVISSAPGAPLKKALIDAGIGSEVYSSYENGIFQPYFSVTAKGADKEEEERFKQIIEKTLEDLAQNGINRVSLLAGINYYEFKYKEADFGSYPKGLMYGLQAYDSWLYDENEPFMHIESNATFAALRSKVEEGYFEELIRKYLIGNPHKAILTVIPVKGLVTKQEKELEKKLTAYKNSLSEEQIAQIVKHTKELKAYQESEDSEEDLQKIPLLKRADLTKEAQGYINEERLKGETKVLYHDIFTNGVSYIRCMFALQNIDEELLPYLSILKTVLGYVDTKNYSYGDLYDQVNLMTGGMSSSVSIYVDSKNLSEYHMNYEVKIKAFDEHVKDAFDLLEEILFTSKLEDKKRLREIIAENKSRVQSALQGSGHIVAALHAQSGFSETACIQERLAGMYFYRVLERLERDFDAQYEEILAKLKECVHRIFRKENFMLDFTGGREALLTSEECLSEFTAKMYTTDEPKRELKITPVASKDGFMSASQVQYVCRAGNYIQKGLPYTGALRVLKVMMGYEYLWLQVRVKGGAYGCMSSFSKTGECYFVSYRDPNLEKTIDVFEHAAEFVKNYDVDERTLTQFVIGTISDKDTPLTPQAKGARSLAAYMSNYTLEDEQKERDEILNIDADTLRSLSEYIDAFIGDGYLCVVGNEKRLKENEQLFDHVEMLFQE